MANNEFEFGFEQLLKQRMALAQDAIESANSPSVATLALGQISPNSSPAMHDESDVADTRKSLIKTEHGNFWIIGNSISCQCPSCSAPMTLRAWLKMADCWRCKTSIELTKEQLAALESLVVPTPTTPKQATQTVAAATPENSKPQERIVATPTTASNSQLEELDRLTRQATGTQFLRHGFAAIPAWLMSLLLHLLLILLLALFVFSTASHPPSITLSSFVGPENKFGGDIRIENPSHTVADDLPIAHDMQIDEQELRDAIKKAQSDAEKILKDEKPIAPLPDIKEVRKNVTTSRDQLMSFAARDPRVRSEVVKNEGGTTLTEAAVARGLRWLATVQNYDGSWSLANYNKSHIKNNEGDAAATSLALLPFLGAGQTHEFGVYRDVVARGLTWLIKHQKSNGDLRINFPGQAGMYAHGQATIVLCEALAMTGDQRFKGPAEKAIRFIERAQHSGGGWRYNPGQAGDTSVLGWQIMALQSAKAGNLGINIDDSTFELADYFLDHAVDRTRRTRGGMKDMPIGSLYFYHRREDRKPTPSMTAEAILCRMYLGWQRNDPRVIEAVRWLIENHLPSKDEKNVYYWYYATQVMHHFGGPVWEVWNKRMREILVAGQTSSGRSAGSWNPKGYQWGRHGGRIYTTSLSVCTLEVYYRHLPLFKQIELDGTRRVSK